MPAAAMTNRTLRLLLLEDLASDAELCERELKRAGLVFSTRCVDSRASYEAALEEFCPDLIISDFSLPNAFDGLAALDLAKTKLPEVPFVFLSGTIGEERAVEAMRRGATDYVLKDRLNRLAPVIKRVLQEVEERAARQRAEAEVGRQRTFLRQLIDLAPIFIFAKDREGRFVLVNQTMANAHGRSVEQLLGKTGGDYNLNEHEVEHFRQVDLKVMDTLKEVIVPEETVTDATGKVRYLHTIKRPIISEDGTAGMVLGVSVDITERKNQEQRIVRLSRFRAVLSGINSTIVRVRDREQLLKDACRIAVEEGQFLLAWIAVLDHQTLELKPGVWHGKGAELLQNLGSSIREDSPEGQGTTALAARSRITVIVNDIAGDPRVNNKAAALEQGFRALIALPLTIGDRLFGVLKLCAGETDVFDQEEVKLLEEVAGNISFALDHLDKAARVDYLAYYDSLTGLPNRSLFYERVAQLIGRQSGEPGSVAVILLDLHRFRSINETLGIAVGDTLLKQVAARLASIIGEPCTMARLNADRFAVAVAEPRREAGVAHLVQNRLLAALEEPFVIAGQEKLRIPARAGIALYPDDGDNAEILCINAEAALRSAKQTGERYLFYAREMNERVAEQLSFESRLRLALREEQFVLHYQPRLEIATGRISGLEALIRWSCPERGLIQPVDFIPLLEETGMILEVGLWALRQAATDHAAWCALGLNPPRVAVNVSAVQLRQKDFVDSFRTAVAAPGGAAGWLDIEMTESILMEDVESTIRKLGEIRAGGIEIAIDDFGTGYSSLSYLVRLPLDTLKIDRSFVSLMGSSSQHMAIVSTVISLAHSLGLKVTAEGVETEDQRNLLALLKCDEMQGNLFSKPLPSHELVEFLRARESPMAA